LRNLLSLSEDDYKLILAKLKRAPSRIPVTVLSQLNWNQVATIEESKNKLTSMFIDMTHNRHYPFNSITAPLIGYLGQFTQQEKEALEIVNINEFNIGKAGIEKYYENDLRGDFGYRQMEINALGKYVRELEAASSKPGKDIKLNIDTAIQEKIFPHLNRQGCSAIVMDNTTGGIVVMASTPTFEANNFSKLSSNYWNELVNDPFKPLINKAVQNSYPPGSVFKIITVLAALEAGITPTKTVTCTGGPALGGNSFRCNAKSGHGTLNMFDAIKYSCNHYMYELGRLIGANKILEVAAKFGFGQLTGIDFPGEAKGFLPSKEWKKKQFKTDWTLGDTFNLSIGQGFLSATPMQMLRFTGAIASGGKLLTPKLVKSDLAFEEIQINPEHLNILNQGLYNAVNTPGGTGYYSRVSVKSLEISGKTGTAQVQAKAHANDDLSRASIAWHKRNHAVFVGFGPSISPRYSITVFVDHGGGGGRAAAPIASRIMGEIFNKYY
jgi:penicillin-binding protein 2